MKFAASFAISLAICSSSASAQLLAVEKLAEFEISPPYAGYTAEIASTGAQGTSVVQAGVQFDGSLHQASVTSSSRSSTLDQLAVAAVSQIKLRTDTGKPLPSRVEIPVKFVRDTLETVAEKTCAEFNLDLAYHKEIFPEKQTREMSVFVYANAILAAVGQGQPGMLLKLAQAQQSFAETAEKECAADPARKLIDVLAPLVFGEKL